MEKLITRASSINRALDQIGDKWCLLIIQEAFWGINSFNDMMAATGASRGVLSDRLKWLQSVDCLSKGATGDTARRKHYHLTAKSLDLYHSALMAVTWERQYYQTPQLDNIELRHHNCGASFSPQIQCRHCRGEIAVDAVDYQPGPGAARDERDKKVRRRSSISIAQVPSHHSLYKNLINIVGDRWTANIIALSFHGLSRFEQFHSELPVATNILADRLKFLVRHGVFEQVAYQQRPMRSDYRLTAKGEDLYPWFLTLLQWGDRWCDVQGKGKPMRLTHRCCGEELIGQVICNHCKLDLHAREVDFELKKPACTGGD